MNQPATNPVRPRALTSHDIARLAGVSQTTVSRVLRDDHRVAPETRERVLKAMADTRFEPNAAARAFRTSRTGSIGVVVARLSNPIYPALLEAIGARLAAAGQRMLVWNAEVGGDLQASQALRQGAVDGVILTTSIAESPFFAEQATPQAPVVLINRTVRGYPGDQVASDNLDGGRRVADYFVAAGRRRIALISGSQQPSTIRDRERGFRAALAAAGIALTADRCQRAAQFSHACGDQSARQLLQCAAPPDAIFCVNDVLALGAIDGARALGLRVPQDVWVVGYDDIEMASWGAYDLTTVHQPMPQMVAHAVERLLARIDDPELPVALTCFPNELVVRGSTDRRPVSGSAGSRGRSTAR